MTGVPQRSQCDGSEHAGSHTGWRGGRGGGEKAQQQRDFVCFFTSSIFSLLLLLLSVCDDVADVLVVYVASNIWGEGGPHILDLGETRWESKRF